MTPLWTIGLFLAGLMAGMCAAWLTSRARAAGLVDAAVSRAQAGVQGELAQLRERALAAAARCTATQAAHDTLQRQADGWRDALDQARDDSAKLTERASRVTALDAELASRDEQLRVGAAQALRLAASEAQKAQAVASLTDQLAELRAELAAQRGATAALQTERDRLQDVLTQTRSQLEAERAGAADKLALLLQARQALSDQFKALASDILEEKSRRFAEQNQASLGQLLDPLRSQLTEFKGKVEEVYVQEGKDRSALSEQVRQLVGLNQSLSQDANNLTMALKGSAKTQGNWGELLLERVLEASGLRKGHDYHVQDSQTREDGARLLADVVIHLPQERRLVVDAKVSLVAYASHVAADNDADRALAVRRHVESLRTHIKGLSGKQYHTLYGLKSLDCVLMFVPIEPAFMMAVTHDKNLLTDAWDKDILLVSPSTLLLALRTVAHVWRQEQQGRNAQEIARRGAELYDRLVGFVEQLQAVGKSLAQAQVAFDAAQNKLSVGKGNVIRQAEMLRDLGVKPTKPLPSALVDRAMAHGDLFAAPQLAALAAASTGAAPPVPPPPEPAGGVPPHPPPH